MSIFELGQVRLFLNFRNDTTGRVEITEPGGVNDLKFIVERESGRLGRDVSFLKDPLTFYPKVRVGALTHRWDDLMRYFNTYGFESEIEFIIQVDGVDTVIGNLDFPTAKTDQIKYLECQVLQQNALQLIKRRKDTSVNVFSNADINGNPITPVVKQKILFPAIPIRDLSEWELTQNRKVTAVGIGISYFALGQNIIRSDIDSTLVPTTTIEISPDDPDDINEGFLQDLRIISAENNLTNVVVDIDNMVYAYEPNTQTSTLKLHYAIGESYDPNKVESVTLPEESTGYSTTIDIGSVQRNENVYLFFTADPGGGGQTVTSLRTFTSFDLSVSATSFAFDTVGDGARLNDVMEYIIPSIGGSSIVAPRFALGGQFYDQYLHTGSLIRGLLDRDFNISFDDIVNHIQNEFYGDYEIQPDGTVFFGLYDDFYRDVEIGSYNIPQTNVFNIRFNERNKINLLNFKYNKYERGQNNDVNRSLQGVHTEAEWSLPNEWVENDKSVTVDYTRDPFSFEKVRRQGLVVVEETAQEQDDDVYINDVVETEESLSRSEQMSVRFRIIDPALIELTNDGSFRFDLLGFQVNDGVDITAGDNIGAYTVGTIGQSSLFLIVVGGTVPTHEGLSVITLDYNISVTNLVLRTNQGFSNINGTTEPTGYPNLMYTIQRNILNFYGRYLKTCMRFRQSASIINTLFRHNKGLNTTIPGEATVTEGAPIPEGTLPNAILTPRICDAQVSMDFNEFWRLQTALRTQRGYVTLVDNLNVVTKIHLSGIEYEWKTNKAIFKDAEIRVSD